MRATLTTMWELSTEYAGNAAGQPRLVHRQTGAVYEARNIVTPYRGGQQMVAGIMVDDLSQWVKLDQDGQALAAAFVRDLAPEED